MDDLAGEPDQPWTLVSKSYVFESGAGRQTLLDLFGTHSQLIVYHLRCRGPDFGARICGTGGFDGPLLPAGPHGAAWVAVAPVPLRRLQALSARFGWTFRWVSSCGSDFDLEYSGALRVAGARAVLFRHLQPGITGTQLQGISGFFRIDGNIFHLPQAPRVAGPRSGSRILATL